MSFIGPGDDGEDATKELLGPHFDRDLIDLAYRALIHGVSFGFWNLDRLHVFPLTEFVPFWDEREGTLRAGARFWRLDPSRPMQVVLYEEGGYTRFESRQDGSDPDAERLVMVFWRSVNLTGNQTSSPGRALFFGFWRSVNLTGNQTRRASHVVPPSFWRSVNLTGNQTVYSSSKYQRRFWRSVNLTGNQTQAQVPQSANLFWRSVNLTGNQTRRGNVGYSVWFWRSVNLTGNQTSKRTFHE